VIPCADKQINKILSKEGRITVLRVENIISENHNLIF